MAKRLNPESAVNDPKHNVAQFNEVLCSTFDEIYKLERRKKALHEQHVKPVQGQITQAWKDCSEATDIKPKQMRTQYAVYKDARDAIEEGKDTVLDQIRMMHEALHEGQSVDWTIALQDVAEFPEPELLEDEEERQQ